MQKTNPPNYQRKSSTHRRRETQQRRRRSHHVHHHHHPSSLSPSQPANHTGLTRPRSRPSSNPHPLSSGCLSACQSLAVAAAARSPGPSATAAHGHGAAILVSHWPARADMFLGPLFSLWGCTAISCPIGQFEFDSLHSVYTVSTQAPQRRRARR